MDAKKIEELASELAKGAMATLYNQEFANDGQMLAAAVTGAIKLMATLTAMSALPAEVLPGFFGDIGKDMLRAALKIRASGLIEELAAGKHGEAQAQAHDELSARQIEKARKQFFDGLKGPKS